MPDRDYYLSDDAAAERHSREVSGLRQRSARRRGHAESRQRRQQIVAIETKLAKSHWTRVQNRDAQKTYNRYEVAALPKLMPGFDWNAFFAGAQIPVERTQALVVVQPSYFEALGKVIADTPVADWRGYFRYKLLMHYAPDLPAKFVQLHFDFNQRTVSGIEELKPRWKRAVDTVEGSVGDLAGKMYVERHFSPDAKRRMDELVGNLLQAYCAGHRLAGMDDAGDQTKGAREAGALHHQDRLSAKSGATGPSSKCVATI